MNDSLLRRHYTLILRTGASVGASLLLAGLVLSSLRSTPALPLTGDQIAERLADITRFDPEAFQLWGIFTLILTPIVRVVWSIGLYLRAKDHALAACAGISLFFIAAGILAKW